MAKIISICLLFLTSHFLLYAQNRDYAALDSAMSKQRNEYPQEKVFVQTDKSYYLADESIWMKAWCTTIEGPTYLSNILYIELTDSKGKVVAKKMYKLDSLGSTAADMNIPASVPSGNYSLNAYTLWMLNFPEFVFRKNIFIYGSDYKLQLATKPKNNDQLKIDFFPEGGDVIAGIQNRVAFKAIDGEGYPANIYGIISDIEGNKVTDASTEHDGMGMLEFTPEAGKKYQMIVTGNKSSRFSLPVCKTEGITLQVNNSNPNRVFVSINRASQNKDSYNNLKIVAQINYQLVYSAMLNIDEGLSAASILKKNLPPGILQITVFNKNNLPLAERIVFVENYQFAQPVIKRELFDNNTKGKNRISFTIDSIGQTALSCMVTCYDEKRNFEENIGTSLLFSSELKGPIHDPAYYLKDKNPVTLRHLDLLLMTQGWRRFNWKKLLAGEMLALRYPVETSISIKGSLHKSDRKEIVTDGKVSFLIRGVDSTTILAEASVTDKGEFLLPDLNFLKRAEIAYMGTDNKRKNFIVDVKLKPNFIDSLTISPFRPTINLDTLNWNASSSQLTNYLGNGITFNDSLFNVKTLSNVTLKARKLSRVDSLNNTYATDAFKMGKSIDPRDFKHFNNIWQMLLASVPGIRIEGNPNDPQVSFNRFSGLAGPADIPTQDDNSELSTPTALAENGIAYYLNEVNVTKDIINSLSIEDVALIKVLKNEAGALGASQGAIAFYTKTGIGITAREYDKRYTREMREGYAVNREFFSPDYSMPDQKNERDNRFTLYWNGNLKATKDGSYRFEFYNNDNNRKFRVIVQGIDAFGQIIYRESIIE